MGGGGKRKQTHWAVRRKNKQARRDGDEGGGDGDGVREGGKGKANEGLDRRLGFSEEIHPGSYAAQRKLARDRGELTDAPVVPEAPKRRYGMWIAFCGKEYSGMQMNEGVKTIEAELERALFAAGAIAETNYGFLQKIGWSRAGRTDKGVHAAGQMVTAKLHVPDDVAGFIEKVNAELPADIRVMHMVTTTKNFNAKMACDKRTYEYLAPSFMFAPRDIVEATPAAGETTETTEVQKKAWSLELLERDGEGEGDDAVVVDASTLAKQRAYRMDDETYLRLLRVLKEFEGTHNFHNYTSKLEPSSPKCQRYMMSFSADRPFVENDMEWVRLRVQGQSFLLHHIRKMVGTACEVVAGVTSIDAIERSFAPEKMDLPKAPSVGLYMAQAHFESYNNKIQESVQTSHPPLDFKGDAAVCARIEQFKKDVIFKHIMAHEELTRTYAKWIKLLSSLPFDYTSRPLEQWKREKAELSAIQGLRKRIEAEREMRKREAEGAAEGADALASAEMQTEAEPKQTSVQDDGDDVSE